MGKHPSNEQIERDGERLIAYRADKMRTIARVFDQISKISAGPWELDGGTLSCAGIGHRLDLVLDREERTVVTILTVPHAGHELDIFESMASAMNQQVSTSDLELLAEEGSRRLGALQTEHPRG